MTKTTNIEIQYDCLVVYLVFFCHVYEHDQSASKVKIFVEQLRYKCIIPFKGLHLV